MFSTLRHHIEKKIPLTDDEFTLASAHFTVRRLKKRQFLLQQGDVCRYESFVVSGCLKSYHTDDQGVDHILRFSVEDHWAGDLDSFINSTPSSFNIEALEPVTLLVIDKPSLDQLYQRVPKLETFFRLLNQNALIATSQRVIKNLSVPASERYQLFLKANPQLVQRIPLKDIASYLGITPVFLSKLRREKPGF
ncbi:Crp/Fnr family transcriptional regulator [Larkinella terrae]|uniref:Cyclic nucleotide-binding domain-containing protein n=1 Tax=Larkinella terrae TaxID=2025311 RepID=A0A7K0ELM5_9BACT|nr:Crp/Fnr family transcriptional regulator [Larkinella terrae]MRS62760.1 cyclic nucleotide-binding domain-containing protein [Larkinella terrae]